jgi:predicted O-methyltransferase YrrM
MIEKFLIGLRYIRFILKARSVFRIHSPFVYSLYSEVLMKRPHFGDNSAIKRVEELVEKLYSCREPLSLRDVGEKSRAGRKATVGNRAKSLSQSERGGRMLFSYIKKFTPVSVLELGTGAGVSALYMAAADESVQISTIEGNSVMAEISEKLIKQSGFSNISVHKGMFDQVLPDVLINLNQVHTVFIDGDHRSESLFRYYEIIRPYLTDDSVVVLHDIYWSADMQKAWKTLIARPEVSISVDVFHFGFLFFSKGIQKQNFMLKI